MYWKKIVRVDQTSCWCHLYTLNTDKMVKAYRYTSVFSVKCLKWKFPGLQYTCNLRINLCYTNSSNFQFVLDRGEGVYSKINEVLLRYYFLLQCTLKCHINMTPHPLHIQAYFFPKISHSKHSYYNHRLLILRDIFDRIFSKTGNYQFWNVLKFCSIVFTETFLLFFPSHKINFWI